PRLRRKTDTGSENVWGYARADYLQALKARSRSNGPDHHLLLSPLGRQSELSPHRDHARGVRSANERAEGPRHYRDRNARLVGLDAWRKKDCAALDRDAARCRL